MEACNPTDLIVVQTTTENIQQAERIANRLVEGSLAACVQISSPIKSVYRWQGVIETSEEYVVSIKTTRARYAEVASVISQLHTYSIPEIIVIPLIAGSDKYVQWLREQMQ